MPFRFLGLTVLQEESHAFRIRFHSWAYFSLTYWIRNNLPILFLFLVLLKLTIFLVSLFSTSFGFLRLRFSFCLCLFAPCSFHHFLNPSLFPYSLILVPYFLFPVSRFCLLVYCSLFLDPFSSFLVSGFWIVVCLFVCLFVCFVGSLVGRLGGWVSWLVCCLVGWLCGLAGWWL